MKKPISFTIGNVNCTYNPNDKGYIIDLPLGLPTRELYGMLYKIKDEVLVGERLFLQADTASAFKNHCKFYKRLGNKVIYELTI